MAIANGLSQAAANTAFLAKGDELFNRPADALYGRFTESVPCDGQFLELDAVGPSPAVIKIIGSRRFASLRAYAHRAPVERWGPDAIELSRLQVERNRNGEITRRLNDYLSAVSNFFEKPATDKLLSNPVGIDGVSLLNDAHPYAYGGGTFDNKTTSALDPSTFEAGITAMSSLRLESGEPAGFYPSVLMVGPKLRKTAMELCKNPLRPVPLSAAGVEAYSSAVAGVAVQNGWAGDIEPVINPRFIGTNEDDWLLMDLRPGKPRPIVIGEALAPMAVVVDNPQSQAMVERSVYQYYVEAQAAVMGYAPFGLYGKLT